MSVFEIEGHAKIRVACDVAKISISFRDEDNKSYKTSQNVLNECDRFIKDIREEGFDPEYIRYSDDSVRKNYNEQNEIYANRSIEVMIPFEMKYINAIQTILQKGKYSYTLTVEGEISDINDVRIELAKQALQESKREAEALAESLGMKVIGVKSIKRDRWNSSDSESKTYDFGNVFGDVFGNMPPRESDEIGSKIIEQSVTLYVSWNLE